MAALLVLSGCDRGPASIPARDHGPASASPFSAASGGGSASGQDASLPAKDPRSEPVPLVDGKPMWAANRRHTAQENAQYQFSRDGADFGARDVNDFVAKAHAFVDSPRAGVQTLTRANGDRLLYDPKTNVFAVVTREGAPRTMFKPRDGAAYWDEQKARVAEDASSGGRRGGYAGRSREEAGDQG